MTIKINCWNEYDRLRTVILGSLFDLDAIPTMYQGKDQEAFVKIVEESTEDLNNIKNILEQCNVQVLRPKQPKNYNYLIGNSIKNHCPTIGVRDCFMAYGDIFFQTYTSNTLRRFESFWVEDIINQIVTDGNLVATANEPNIDIKTDYLDKVKKEETWLASYQGAFKHKNLVHCAGILKHNKTAFSHSNIGTSIGKQWIKKWLEHIEVEMLECEGFGHIDATTSILGPDLIISSNADDPFWSKFNNRIKVNPSKEKTKSLNNYEIMTQVSKPGSWLYEWQGHFQQFSINTNLLMIDPNRVLISYHDDDIWRQLQSHGIEPIYAPWRHGKFWTGGLHCITCDLHREN
jgi:N-dimethylarginine dimethylaminohydrolase